MRLPLPTGNEGGATSAKNHASTTASGSPKSAWSDRTASRLGLSEWKMPCDWQRNPTSIWWKWPHGQTPGLQTHGLRQVQVQKLPRRPVKPATNQTHTVIKMKLRPKIDNHDYETRRVT